MRELLKAGSIWKSEGLEGPEALKMVMKGIVSLMHDVTIGLGTLWSSELSGHVHGEYFEELEA